MDLEKAPGRSAESLAADGHSSPYEPHDPRWVVLVGSHRKAHQKQTYISLLKVAIHRVTLQTQGIIDPSSISSEILGILCFIRLTRYAAGQHKPLKM
jgi:hypothetical protein